MEKTAFKNFCNTLLDILLFIWMLPQNVAGMILYPFAKVIQKERFNRVVYLRASGIKSGSISLGRFIFLCEAHWGKQTVKAHEYGHFLQACRIGWLFLPAIGIPSIIWAGFFGKWRQKHRKTYYWFYTEAWADKLSNIKR